MPADEPKPDFEMNDETPDGGKSKKEQKGFIDQKVSGGFHH